MKMPLVFTLCLGLSLLGCCRKPPAPSAPARSAGSAISVASQAEANAPPPPPAAPGAVTSVEVSQVAAINLPPDQEASAKELTAAIQVYLQVRPETFRWLSGEDHAVAYESSPGNKRAFCRTCGSVAPIRTAYGAVRVPGGALDEDPGGAPEVTLFTKSKAAWCTADEARRTFSDAGPPEFWSGIVRRLYGGG